jgi:hypothetical protein
VSCCALPTTTLADAGSILMAATGAGPTVSTALPVLPSLIAEIVADPGAIAVITPLVASTVATLGAFELHATVRPVSAEPVPSSVVAVAWEVPTAVIEVGASTTETDATGTGATVSTILDVTPPALALMVTVPTLRVVIRPVGEMLATVGSVVDHATFLSVSVLPAASVRIVDSCSDSPTTRDTAFAEIGLSGGPRISTADTGTGNNTAYVLKCDTCALTIFASVSTVEPGSACHPVVVDK